MSINYNPRNQKKKSLSERKNLEYVLNLYPA